MVENGGEKGLMSVIKTEETKVGVTKGQRKGYYPTLASVPLHLSTLWSWWEGF